MIALLTRDLRLAIRAGGGFGLGLAFFLLLAVIVPLGVGPEPATLAKIAPGILWVGHFCPAFCRLTASLRWISKMARWTFWPHPPCRWRGRWRSRPWPIGW